MISITHKYTKSTIMVSWVISYVAILLFPLIMSIFVYTQSYNIISKQLTESHTKMLNQMQTHMDEKFREITDFSMKISFVSDTSKIVNFSSEDEFYKNSENIQHVQNFSQLFSIYNPGDTLLKNLYLFMPKSNIVWVNSNYYNKNLFFKANINREITESDWDYLNGNTISAFEIARLGRDYSSSSGDLMLIYPLFLKNGISQGTIAVSFDEANIISYMRQISQFDTSTVAIVNSSNEILFSTSSSNQALADFLKSKKDTNGELISYSQGKQKFAVYSSNSTIAQIKYICMIPENVITKQLIYIKSVMIISEILCGVFGGILILMLTKRNYNPIRDLITTVKANSNNGNKVTSKNEFLFIRSALMDVYEKNKLLEERMHLQDKKLCSNYLNRLLHGKVSSNELSEDVLQSFEFRSNADNFAVMLCYLDGKNNWLDKYEYSIDNYLNFFEENFIAPLKEQLGIGYSFTCIDTDDFITCIIGFDDNCLPIWKQTLSDALAVTTKELELQKGIRYIFSASSAYQDLIFLPTAFDDAMLTMEYRIFDCETILLFKENIMPNDGTLLKYTSNEEQKLINCIRICDVESAVALINMIFDGFVQSMPSFSLAKCLTCDIAGTLIKVIEQDNLLQKEQGKQIMVQIESIVNQKTIKQMRSILILCLTEICTIMREEKPVTNRHAIVKKIDLLIEKNLHNESLGVAFLSEQVHLNPRYLSALYKEETCTSITDCIHKKRISEFKELVMQKNVSVGDAAKAVGYCSVTTFIRWFKKYEGITPSQLKRLD